MKVTIHQKKHSASKVDMIRIEAAFKGITADEMFDYFTDPP